MVGRHPTAGRERDGHPVGVRRPHEGRPQAGPGRDRVARAVWRVIAPGHTGLCHVSSADETSWHDFAREIFRLEGLTPALTPVSSDEYGARAKRPRWPPTWPSAARSALRLAPAPDTELPDDDGRQPRRMPLKEHGRLAVAGDHDLAAPPPDRADDLARRARRRHDQELRDRLRRLLAQDALVVDTTDLGGDEAGAHQRHGHARACQLVAERLGERTHGELAHRVGRRAGRGDVAADAADDGDPAAGASHVSQRRLERAQDTEDVRLELAPIVIEPQQCEWPNHAEAGVGHDDVEPAEALARCGGRPLRVAVDGDVTAHGDRARAAGGQLDHQPVEAVGAARGQHERSAAPREFPSQRLADAGRGTGDQHRLPAEVAHAAANTVAARQGVASVIASSAYADAVFALRMASPWSFLVFAFSWCVFASPTSFLASAMSGVLSAFTLVPSAFLMRSSACLMTTGQLNAHAGAATASTSIAIEICAFIVPSKMVGVRGFEPPAPCSQSRCATGLRHTPPARGNVSAQEYIIRSAAPGPRARPARDGSRPLSRDL